MTSQKNVNKLNHSSPMTNTVTNKIKHYPQLFALGPQIPLKLKWHYFFPQRTISTKLDIYVYKWKDANICKGLLQIICLIIIKYLTEFFT